MKKVILSIIFSSMFLYGGALEEGTAHYVKGNYKKAIQFYQEACVSNNAEGCFKLAHMYENKQGVEQDFQKAYNLYDRSCALSHAKGCFKVGVCFDKGGVLQLKQDYAKAEYYYKKSCENGFALSCYNLGGLYQYSYDTKLNKENMISMYKQSCEGGARLGCYKLGNIYESKEKDKAVKWYKKGCDLEDTQSCFRLGDILVKEIAALDPTDFPKLFEKYTQECKAGDMSQCYRLGIFYSTGRGVKQSYTQAKNVYEISCSQGDKASCMEYMMLTESGF